MQIIYETNKLKELFNGIHEKFLKAIDHMEFHPTLGKEKKGTSFKLCKCSVENIDASMAHQLKYLNPDDTEMLRQGNKIIQKIYLGLSMTQNTEQRDLVWLLGFWVGQYTAIHETS